MPGQIAISNLVDAIKFVKDNETNPNQQLRVRSIRDNFCRAVREDGIELKDVMADPGMMALIEDDDPAWLRDDVLPLFKKMGITVKELREEKHGGFKSEEFVDAEFDVKELKEAGFTAKDLKAAGLDVEVLTEAGFTLVQVCSALDCGEDEDLLLPELGSAEYNEKKLELEHGKLLAGQLEGVDKDITKKQAELKKLQAENDNPVQSLTAKFNKLSSGSKTELADGVDIGALQEAVNDAIARAGPDIGKYILDDTDDSAKGNFVKAAATRVHDNQKAFVEKQLGMAFDKVKSERTQRSEKIKKLDGEIKSLKVKKGGVEEKLNSADFTQGNEKFENDKESIEKFQKALNLSGSAFELVSLGDNMKKAAVPVWVEESKAVDAEVVVAAKDADLYVLPKGLYKIGEVNMYCGAPGSSGKLGTKFQFTMPEEPNPKAINDMLSGLEAANVAPKNVKLSENTKKSIAVQIKDGALDPAAKKYLMSTPGMKEAVKEAKKNLHNAANNPAVIARRDRPVA